MRILYLSQYFPPEMGAPAARVYELSREWARLGHEVQVLTGFPNHPTGVVPPEYRGELWRRERVDGIEVLRTPIYAAANRGRVRRSANYLSYAASAGSVGALLARRPDVVLATSPQFLTGLAGFWLAKLFRRPFVFEVRDLWPRSIVAVGALAAHSPVVRALEVVERTLYRGADRIVTVTDSFVEEIASTGVARSKLSVVKNGVDLELFRPGPRDDRLRRELGLEGKFVATYIGTHGMAHGLGTILDAAAALRNDARFAFLLIGEGAEKRMLQARAATEGLTHVRFLDQQPREKLPAYLAASDLCLVLLRAKPLFRTVIPSKIFELWGCGRPIALGVEGEARGLVEESGGGVAFPPEDSAALVRLMRELAADPERANRLGRAGRRDLAAHFSRPVLAKRYLDILGEVAAC
ncbi:MAG: glycosyltransferase family 4 protein [Myxococcales bacterium]